MSIEVRGVCVLLQVFDMPASVRFYRDVLWFEVVRTSARDGDQFDWGMLRLGEATLMLNTAYEQEYRPPQPDKALVAGHGDTCLYFGCIVVTMAIVLLCTLLPFLPGSYDNLAVALSEMTHIESSQRCLLPLTTSILAKAANWKSSQSNGTAPIDP